MAVARRIAFREVALFDASIYTALIADGVESYDHDATHGVVETFDSKASDYSRLREALQAGHFSYAVYQQREGDGDHIHWKYSFAGEEDHHRSDAPGPIQFVRDVTR